MILAIPHAIAPAKRFSKTATIAVSARLCDSRLTVDVIDASSEIRVKNVDIDHNHPRYLNQERAHKDEELLLRNEIPPHYAIDQENLDRKTHELGGHDEAEVIRRADACSDSDAPEDEEIVAPGFLLNEDGAHCAPARVSAFW